MKYGGSRAAKFTILDHLGGCVKQGEIDDLQADASASVGKDAAEFEFQNRTGLIALKAERPEDVLGGEKPLPARGRFQSDTRFASGSRFHSDLQRDWIVSNVLNPVKRQIVHRAKLERWPV
jgi:hypothetical protein